MPVPTTFEEALRTAGLLRGREGQKDVFDAFRSGKHVILHAPTGWGKTFAVLAALDSGHAIYSLPLRVLVDSLVRDANEFSLRRCTAHHGARKEHAFLDRGDDPAAPIECVFTTLDQSLSAFLGIPIGVSVRQGNILPAVIDASHLVFDEFHLFDPARSWTTALFALQHGKQNGILLTATFSDAMVEFLIETLGATPHGVELVQAGRPFVNAKHVNLGKGLDNTANLALGERTIVIRNQIDGAKRTALALRSDLRVRGDVYLLHSELLPEHRRAIELKVSDVFGKKGAGPAVLVATQVIEAGIDITCDVLHTDLCPPASFIQRIGRCARFEGEEGQIYLHPVESSSPYRGAEDEMQRLAEYLQTVKAITPEAERAIVNFAAERDRQAIAQFRLRSNRTVDQVRVERDYAAYAEMIRSINNVNVAIGTSPDRLYHFISVAQSKFFGNGTYADLTTTPVQIDFDRKQRKRVAQTTENIKGADFVLLDPDEIGYSSDVGLIVGESLGEEHFRDTSPRIRKRFDGSGSSPVVDRLAPRTEKGRSVPELLTYPERPTGDDQPQLGHYRFDYDQENAEPYRLHIENLVKYRPVCQWMVERLADHVDGMERATYLADFVVWAHDLGKLNIAWQQAFGVPLDGVPIAHSGKDYPPLRRRPAHAWVSAWAVADFLWNQLFHDSQSQRLRRPVFWAIAHHHGYSLNPQQRQTMEPYRLGFLDYLDSMEGAEPCKANKWGSSILSTQALESDLDRIFSQMEKEHLRISDAVEVYYMLSYILRCSDQLATAEVSTEVAEEFTLGKPTNIL